MIGRTAAELASEAGSTAVAKFLMAGGGGGGGGSGGGSKGLPTADYENVAAGRAVRMQAIQQVR